MQFILFLLTVSEACLRSLRLSRLLLVNINGLLLCVNSGTAGIGGEYGLINYLLRLSLNLYLRLSLNLYLRLSGLNLRLSSFFLLCLCLLGSQSDILGLFVGLRVDNLL